MKLFLIVLLLWHVVMRSILCYQNINFITKQSKSMKLSRKMIKYQRLVLYDMNKSSIDPSTTSGSTSISNESTVNKDIQKYAIALLLILSSYEVYVNHPLADNIMSTTYVSNYWRYFLCGAVSCAFSHVITVPFDVIKTRIQVNKQEDSIENNSNYDITNKKDKLLTTSSRKLTMISVATDIIQNEGMGTLLTGIIPTFVGFSIQGAFKYGFYEVFKPIVKDIALSLNHHYNMIALNSISSNTDSNSITQSITNANDDQFLTGILALVISAASAEFIGTFFLTPFETARVRLVSDSKYAPGIVECIQKIIETEGTFSLVQGFPAMLLKALPYTAFQLVSFELATSYFYQLLAQAGYSSVEALQYKYLVTTVSAVVAAVISSLASQPGDTLFSLVASKLMAPSTTINVTTVDEPIQQIVFTSSMNTIEGQIVAESQSTFTTDEPLSSSSQANPFSIISATVSEVGVKGLYKGTKARLVHVLFIVVIQLLCYDTVKQLVGIPVTGFH